MVSNYFITPGDLLENFWKITGMRTVVWDTQVIVFRDLRCRKRWFLLCYHPPKLQDRVPFSLAKWKVSCQEDPSSGSSSCSFLLVINMKLIGAILRAAELPIPSGILIRHLRWSKVRVCITCCFTFSLSFGYSWNSFALVQRTGECVFP